MQYKILANKWRPKNLDDIIGQDKSIYIIKNIIKSKNIPYSYIISGPQGVGKTSLARIITKCLNCEINITLTPCELCYCCKSINICKNTDSIEIDAASNTKIEDIKEIIDLSKYKNSINRYKTYIIDECHMLSQNSFNYLLKILEEPINDIIYILITTQIEKIPQTIISRCIDIQLNKISNKNIKIKLTEILDQEKIIYDTKALEYISIFANGSLRQAFNTLEKIINITEKHITIKNTRNVLGILPELSILFIIKNIYDNDAVNLISNIKQIIKQNLNYKNLLTQIQIILYKIMLHKLKINYDSTISKYKIFLYLSTNLTKSEINNIYIKLLKKQIDFANITEIDFEIILIDLTLEIKS